MSRRDPYEGDEAAGWGTFADPEPRWRDDDPGQQPYRGADPYAEPAPGRSVFGNDAPPASEPYEDTYSDQSYGDQSYQPGGYDDRGFGAPPGYSDARGYDDRAYRDQSFAEGGFDRGDPHAAAAGGGVRYTDTYGDDAYSDDVYQDEPRVFVDAPGPPGGTAAVPMGPQPGPEGLPPRSGARRNRMPSQGGGPDRDLKMAVAVGVGLALTALVLFKVGPAATLLLAALVIGVAAFEYFTAIQRAGFDPLLPVGVVASVGAVIATYHRGEGALPLVLVLSVAVCMVWYLIGAGGEKPMANVAATLLGICWVGMFGAFAGLLLGAPNGVALLLAAVVPTIGYDVGALFVGRSAGSRPLSAASPNKTVEGLVGGMVLAVVGGLLLGVVGVHPFDSIGEGLRVGLVAALAAPLGDLSESLIKRDLRIKDMGTMLPGHGGVLDRFDAMLFVLPAIWYLSRVSDFFLV
jgi:CDP-diglyceride synthetase